MNILFIEETDSTQRIAYELVVKNDRGWDAVCADHQTTGRGRHGNEWYDEPNACLLTSLILWDVQLPEPPGLLGVMSALATAEALETAYPSLPPIQLKYPNDLFVHGRKLGGILVEVVHETAIVGIGVNLAQQSFPPGLASSAISVQQAIGQGEKVDAQRPAREYLIATIWHYLTDLYRRWQADRGTLYTLWQGRDATIGRTYRVLDYPDQPIGTAMGVEPDFRLRLRLPDGSEWATYLVESVK